jgi:GH25 family lysozyme M1 (1,4-beta-N-acetylmuramidase)
MVRTRNCALVALVACLPVAVLATPAQAEPAIPTITHPQDDWAGSQIARHEGTATRSRIADGGPETGPAPTNRPPPAGLDVSGHQGDVNWSAVVGGGGRFAYVKATEATSYVNPYFARQYRGAYAAGLIRGAYHFATPNTAGGAAQADYFVNHGGGWSGDGRTLPPAIDLEYNPYGASCYGMSAAALGSWVRAFVNRVHARTGRYPTIYTSTRWWSMCMGGDAGFGADPLWIARYNSSLGGLPPGWRSHTIWQFADSGRFPGDQDRFNGTRAQLRTLATG